MLFFSGGAANPLISYFLVLLLIAAYSLPLKHTIALTTLCIVDYSLLMLWHQPLISNALESEKSLFDLHLLGMWLNFVVSAVKIGRASCRERVYISVVAELLKKK